MHVSLQESLQETVQEPQDILDLDGESVLVPSSPPAPHRKWLARPYVAYLLFALGFAVYLLPFMRFLSRSSVEGTLVYDAARIVHGQVFARDFFEVIGPGTFYWLALFFKIFGVTFVATRICLFVTSLGTLLSMYYLSRRVCERFQALVSTLLIAVYFSAIWPMVSHHTDSTFFALLSVVCVARWQDTRNRFLLVAAGALAAVTTCVLQPKGLLLLLAMLLWLWIERRRGSASLSAIGVLLAGYSGVAGAVLLYFWSRGALHDLISMNVVWPFHHYATVNAVPYASGLLKSWTHWRVSLHPWLLPLALACITSYLFVAALPVLVIALGIPHGKDNLRPEILLLWFCGWALWLSEIHRRDLGHLVVGSPLLMILAIHFLAEYRGKIAELSLQVLAISAGALATANLFLVLSATSVPTRVGPVATFKTDPVLAFLGAHTAPGEEIFAYPYCPMYYFLSGTMNPTRYSLLIYNYNTPSQFQRAIRTLDRRKVRYVVWDTSFASKVTANNFFSASAFRPSAGFPMEVYLQSHYRLVKDVNGVRIMERKVINDAH
ncbi:MAG: glycosyltransferase family 39 protein [Acidobacteriaceae bacterium]